MPSPRKLWSVAGLTLLLAGCSPEDVPPITPLDAGPQPVGCTVTAPTECPDPVPTYADVEPIFVQRCQTCHDGRSGQWPLTSYRHVADWHEEIKGEMYACSMPPKEAQLPMPVEERELILAWLLCGFPQ